MQFLQIVKNIWNFISSAAAFIALCGLIRQIRRDRNSKRPLYRLEITRWVKGRDDINSDDPADNKYTITIRNTGNRVLLITKFGFVRKEDLITKSRMLYMPYHLVTNFPLGHPENTYKITSITDLSWASSGFPFVLNPGDMALCSFKNTKSNSKDKCSLVQRDWENGNKNIVLAVQDGENRLHWDNFGQMTFLKNLIMKFCLWKANRYKGYKS